MINNGTGILEKQKGKIFEIFGVARSDHGKGLGLYLASIAMGRLGGEITLESHAKPTIFKIVIPNTGMQLDEYEVTGSINPYFFKDNPSK